MDYKKKKHAVFLCTYHVIFVTKYRKPVISNMIGDELKNYTDYLLCEAGCELISAETDRDHIHFLMSLPPDMAPTTIIRMLKTQLSKHVKQYHHDHFRKYYFTDDTPLWSPSYFIATTGSVSLEKVREYVNNQRSEEHQSKRK